MASKTKDAAEFAAVEAAEPVVAPVTEKKIPIEKLRRSCLKLFGITPSTFDGATVGLTGSYTVKEIEAIIKKWLNKEVK